MIGCLWTRASKQPIIALYLSLSLRMNSGFIISGPGPCDPPDHNSIQGSERRKYTNIHSINSLAPPKLLLKHFSNYHEVFIEHEKS